MTVNVSVNASPQGNDKSTRPTITKKTDGTVVGIAAAVVFGVIVVLIFYLQKRRRQNRRAHDSAGARMLSHDPYAREDNILRTIRPKKVGHQDRRVKGLTILNDELFVAFEMSAVIEMFNIDNSTPTRSAKVERLVDPGAIAACATNICIYIVDKKKNDGKTIFRVDPNGAEICAWETDDDDKGRISINREGNVVMTVYDKHKLKIYSPDGKLLKQETVDFCDWRNRRFCRPTVTFIFHAINLDDGNFILCHGIYKSKVHRVCMVDRRGKVLRSFGSKEGSDNEHLSSPAYLARRNDGSILAADQKNHRIILLNSDLTFKKVLFTKENDGVSFPTSMCVYEKTGSSLSSLFLGCNKTTNSGGYVLVLRLGQ